MPVREIPRYGSGHKNLGKFASVKTGRVAWYESLLERDFMYLLDYDRNVSYWHEQPLRIHFSHGGKVHRYTPDLEVHRASQKQLIEVKPKHQVDSGKWEVLFRAASSICEEEGYQFLVVTDEIIRVQPRLENVKLLWKYARTPVLVKVMWPVLEYLEFGSFYERLYENLRGPQFDFMREAFAEFLTNRLKSQSI